MKTQMHSALPGLIDKARETRDPAERASIEKMAFSLAAMCGRTLDEAKTELAAVPRNIEADTRSHQSPINIDKPVMPVTKLSTKEDNYVTEVWDMANGPYVAYYRVSTERQGASGLGLEAQRASVVAFLNGGDWRVSAEFTEVESGKNNARSELAKAIGACRLYGAKLLIAKIDRLSRDAHFLLGLEKAGVEFTAADMPGANRLTVGIMAMVAEEERRMISARTKAALAAAKARGTKLGGFRGSKIDDAARALGQAALKARVRERNADLMPPIAELRAAGASSLREIAAGLNARGITTFGGGQWSAVQVKRVLDVGV